MLMRKPAPGKDVAGRRRACATYVRSQTNIRQLRVLMRPLGTQREPPLDPFGRELFAKEEVHLRKLAEQSGLSKEEALDNLLLVLSDALFLAQADKWTDREVANLPADETYELARWFLLGQNVGKNPIFDGICAQCGALLYGVQNKSHALSNKCSGPPADRDGNLLKNPDGTPQSDAQPPFLLRYSPSLFGTEAPAMFVHDPETNTLALKPGARGPWLRPTHASIPPNDPNTWLYCAECKDRYFPRGVKKAHIPFRDKASQHYLKPTFRRGKQAVGADQPEPEGEPDEAASTHASDAEEVEDVAMDEPIPESPPEVAAPRPPLEALREKWERGKAWHARAVAGEFSSSNLIPTPEPQLWQDCPYVPFDKLKSTVAQSRLSVCRPFSGLEQASCAGGVPRYAHNTGGVMFRRWAPLQIANTMGLILNKKSGKTSGLTPEELNAVYECLTWGREEGNNKVLAFFGTVFESYDAACGTLMRRFKSVMPEGCPRARIRATRRRSLADDDGCLADTLGDEATGMVVVDAGGHPMKYDSLTVLQDDIDACDIRRVRAKQNEARLFARVAANICVVKRQAHIRTTSTS